MPELIQRRNFLIGLGSLLTAPAIVRVGSIMPVKAVKPNELLTAAQVMQEWLNFYHSRLHNKLMNNLINYEPGDIVEITTLYGKVKMHKITEMYNVSFENKA